MAVTTTDRAPDVPDPAAETTPLLRDHAAGSGDSGGSVEANAPSVEEPPHEGLPEVLARMHILLPAIGIGIYMGAMDQMLTVASYPRIGSELNALNSTSWIATAYFLTLTSFQPLYGKLSDIFGRKECLLFAYTVFGLGCLGCGLSQNMLQLCLSRAVAGIGGGGMNSVVSILISDIVPFRDRGLWQGYINIIFATGTSTGAPLGGLLVDSVGWRWSFLGQVPLCAIAFTAVSLCLHLPKSAAHASHWREKIARIDFLGAAILILAVVGLLTGLDSGSNRGWSDRLTVASLSITPLLFGAFLYVESHIATEPFAPGRIIFDRSLSACYLGNFFAIAGHTACIFFAPLFFQAVQGLSTTESGMRLVPCMVCAVAASLFGGYVIKKTGRYFWITVGGYAFLFLASVPLMVSIYMKSTLGVVLALAGTACGAGSAITTTLIALLSNSSTADTAVVIATSYLFRSLGSSIGISVSSAVLQQVLQSELATRLGGGDAAREVEERVRQDLRAIGDLPAAVEWQVREAYRIAVGTALGPAVAVLAVAVVVTFFVKEKSMKR
ncbi:related to multidrug resistance protein [Cephalotrichum gorgonifer]|uniref:Related to multidrug resistance protein n=1 Tax=Cephalotrichum gorgonifer TaxID=2041049 RepID=A0AAE8STU8_9PEZI|nr:related to multidrug resistance protein [Cephalotrichum gorgonifer]